MGAADPAVEPEELDPVCPAAERLLPGCCQPQPEAREGPAVAERRRRREAVVPSSVSTSLALSLPERREGSVEPGVAEEGRRLRAVASRQTPREVSARRPRSPGARAVRCRRAHLRARAARRAGGSSAAARNGSSGESRVAHSASRGGLRGLEGGPRARRRRRARQVLRWPREGQSVSSSAAVNSPSPAKDGLPGKVPITISSGAPSSVWASASASTSWSWS